MSVNYHAYQNRNVLFTDYEAISEQWWEQFAGFDPGRIARILNLKCHGIYLYVKYLGEDYRLNLENGHMQKFEENDWTDRLYFNETMAIYHLLSYTKDQPREEGDWVPSYTIDGVVARNRSLPDPLFTPFAKLFEGRPEELRAACEEVGGTFLKKGDLAFEFEIFPQIHLELVFWDADEDFPAQVQIQVKENITDFIHYETVGCLISDLFEKIKRCSE